MVAIKLKVFAKGSDCVTIVMERLVIGHKVIGQCENIREKKILWLQLITTGSFWDLLL